ncbi:MAG: DUF3656 domain-containing U32 family peptidase [Moorellales bacterium]
MVRLPELLAPAGDWEALKAAVANGADAVYLGGKEFSARAYAPNFSETEMAEAVRFCHLRGVKVYVAVNTLVAPEELDRALDYLFRLAEWRVDGVLLQDLGLAWAAHQALPRLPLHASTQMTVHNPQGVRFLARLGFCRVVLARELSLAEVKKIGEACPEVEREVFVHGALCFSYSGQCLLSSFVGGRSGNRGRCAQPCRLPYRLRGAKTDTEGYLLSTRDLMTLDLLPELVGAGIQALKIEGRMKRPEYVATVTRIYRQALDRLAANPEGFRPFEQERQELAQIFNREFTAAYLLGRRGEELMSFQRPNNRGTYLGRVVAKSTDRVAVRLAAPLRVGDGVEFWVTQGGRAGITVRRLEANGQTVREAEAGHTVWLGAPAQVAVGDRVFKTHDALLVEKARASYTRPQATQVVPLWLEVKGEPGRPLVVTGRDDRGVLVAVTSEEPCRRAEKHPLIEEVLARQLGRLGDTPFYLADLEIQLSEPVMLPLSSLNRIRRRLVAELEEARLTVVRNYPPPAQEEFIREVRRVRARSRPPEAVAGLVPRLTVAVTEPEAAQAALEAGADRVYLGAEQWQDRPAASVRDWKPVVRWAKKEGREVFVGLPRFWHPSEVGQLEERVELARSLGVPGVLIPGPAGWEEARERLEGLRLVADYTFNIFNPPAAALLRSLGFAGLTLSPELNRGQLAAFSPLAAWGAEVVVHGNFPLMSAANCVLRAVLSRRSACRGWCRQSGWSLTDRQGYEFPVACDQGCRFYVFNSRELCLLAELPDLLPLRPFGLRLELRRARPEEVFRIVAAYREGLSRLEAGGATREWLRQTEERILAGLNRGFTRGHYRRGV